MNSAAYPLNLSLSLKFLSAYQTLPKRPHKTILTPCREDGTLAALSVWLPTVVLIQGFKAFNNTMMNCDDYTLQKLDMLTKRMIVKLDKEKISKSSKAMKLAKKFMGNMEKTSDSEDGQKRTIRMIDNLYKLNTSYWDSEASEDDDTDSEDDDFEVDTSTKRMLGTAKLNKEKTSKSSEVGHKKIIERFNKPNELKASVWDDDFIGKFYREMYSESEASKDDDLEGEASEDDDLEELFFREVKAIKNAKMKCDDVIQHSDKFEKLKKRMMGNTSLNEEKASESEGTSSCPEHVGLAEMENDNAIVLRGGTEAPLCASVDKDGKLTKSPRIAFE